MPPQPPPLDATPFLSDEQQQELGNVPLRHRLLGAWLIVIRDDYLGQWKTRRMSCVECVDQRLPCVDRASPESASQCEGCRLNGFGCRDEYDVATDTDAGRALADRIFSKKRKPSSGEASPSCKVPKIERPHANVVSDPDVLETIHDRPSASSAKSGATTPTSLPSTLPSSLPLKPAAPLGIPEDIVKVRRALNQIQSILDKARRRARENGFHVNVKLDQKVEMADLQRYDYSVILRSPGSLPTWLLVIVDHRKRRGKVLFDDRTVPGRSQCPVQVCLERAFYIFHKAVSLEAEIYPCLDKESGNLYATALAVEFIVSGRGVPGHELIVDEKEAAHRHRMLLAEVQYPSSAVTVGRRSTVVAHISRHERRFERVNDRDHSRRSRLAHLS